MPYSGFRLRFLLPSNTCPFIINDVRFEKEADYIRQQGGVIWHIKRDVPQMEHDSEKGITVHPVDVTIYNDRDIEWLFNTVKTLLES